MTILDCSILKPSDEDISDNSTASVSDLFALILAPYGKSPTPDVEAVFVSTGEEVPISEETESIVIDKSLQLEETTEGIDRSSEWNSIQSTEPMEVEEEYDKDEDGNLYDSDGELVFLNFKKICNTDVPDPYSVHFRRICKTYQSSNRGVYITKKNSEGEEYEVQVCATPCIPTKRGIPLDGDETWYELAYVDIYETRHSILVRQEELMTKKGVSGLNRKGIRLTDNQRGELTNYFNAVLSYNEYEMPTIEVAEKNGWKNYGKKFVFGSKAYTKNGTSEVHMQEQKMLNNLRSKGTLDEMVEGTKGVMNIRKTRFKCYAAAAALILKLLGVENILINDGGTSSRGKTTTTKVPFGLFGNPNEDGMMNEDISLYAAERIAVQYSDLPTFYDEISGMDDYSRRRLIYAIGDGIARTRGNVDMSIGGGECFNTVSFFTSENPLIQRDYQEGLKVRVIEILEVLPEEYSDIMKLANQTMKFHYGHLADLYIPNIFKHQDELPQMYSDAMNRISNSGKSFEGRFASKFAAIEVAGKLLEPILRDVGYGLMDVENIVDHYFKTTVLDKPIEEPHIIVLGHMMDWFTKNEGKFVGMKDCKSKAELDKFEKYGWVDNQFIDIIPDELEKAMAPYCNGNFKAILDKWLDIGVLVVGKGDGKRNRYKAHNMRVFRLFRLKINEILDF